MTTKWGIPPKGMGSQGNEESGNGESGNEESGKWGVREWRLKDLMTTQWGISGLLISSTPSEHDNEVGKGGSAAAP
jgi:hypothetical protein